MQTKKYIRISELLFKEITGLITSTEKDELAKWSSEKEANKNFINNITSSDLLLHGNANYEQFKSQVAFDKLMKKVKREKRSTIFKQTLKYAALLVLIISIPLFFTLYKNKFTEHAPVASDILHGSSKGTLILADGKKIRLNEKTDSEFETLNSVINSRSGTLSYAEKEMANEQAPEEKLNILLIPKGGEFNLKLSDGTEVIINSDTKIIYPEKFIGNVRKIFLDGEAFFKVAYDPSKQFVVETNEYNVNVLGTAFNVSSYHKAKNSHTTLVEGSVEISGLKSDPENTFSLAPNQQFQFDKDNFETNIKPVATELFTAWTMGYFLFEDNSLEFILQKLARWYDLEIFFEDSSLKNKIYSGKLPRFENFNVILDLLETIDNVKFNANDKTITVSKN